MDTTSSGTRIARRFGHRRTPSPAVHRWTMTAAFLAAILAMSMAAPADSEDVEYSIASPLASRSLMLDAAVAGDRIVAVGERGHILISSDGGSSWRHARVPTRTMLTAVTFTDETTGFAVGHDSVILRTTDAGETWERVHWAPEDEAPLFDVWFADASTGVAIGAYGSHFITDDGGATWVFEPLGDTDWHLHQIARADDGRLYIAAEAGNIYRSDDGGDTWTELVSPYEGSYFGVLPLGGETVLVFGLRGHLYRSEDAGESWEEIPTGTVALLDAGVRLADGTVLVAGLAGTVLVSSDDGKSFSRHQEPGRRGITSVIQTADGSLLATGEFGLRLTTLAELTADIE